MSVCVCVIDMFPVVGEGSEYMTQCTCVTISPVFYLVGNKVSLRLVPVYS